MNREQKEIKIEPRIKLQYNIYTEADKSNRGRRKLQSIFFKLEIQKRFVDNTDFSLSKYKKFCSGQISTPLLQFKDIEIFTKI